MTQQKSNMHQTIMSQPGANLREENENVAPTPLLDDILLYSGGGQIN